MIPENSKNLEPFADIDLEEMSAKLIDYLRKELGSKSVNYLERLTRLTGGYETFICRFQLNGVVERLSNPLIIRVYAKSIHPLQPLKENLGQNTLTDLGYPVPAVHCTCTDKTILGRPFIVMDYFEGKTLLDMNMPFDQVFDVLGKLHAKLHNIDPEPIVRKFAEAGVDSRLLKFESMLMGFRTQVDLNFSWLKEAVEWLFENRPNDPETLSICHDDFHPGNILFKDGKIKAVLDWSGFLIGDSAMDVALTILLITIPTKLFSPDLDSEKLSEMYLNAYRKKRPLDETNITYYGTVRSALALKEGVQGHVVWGHPKIIQLLLAYYYKTTGVKINIPS